MAILKTLTINGTVYTLTPTVPTASVTLLASAWTGSDHHYSQVVNIPGVTPYTKVDLQPTAEQMVEFHTKSVGFVAENEDGRAIIVNSLCHLLSKVKTGTRLPFKAF